MLLHMHANVSFCSGIVEQEDHAKVRETRLPRGIVTHSSCVHGATPSSTGFLRPSDREFWRERGDGNRARSASGGSWKGKVDEADVAAYF